MDKEIYHDPMVLQYIIPNLGVALDSDSNESVKGTFSTYVYDFEFETLFGSPLIVFKSYKSSVGPNKIICIWKLT